MDMDYKIRNVNGLLGGTVISTQPPKCETCQNDAVGTNCVKLLLHGGRLVCLAKK